ncbi:hypothetical protein EDC01DRAFT_648706 [Geopyxis carbonaria]|nr:hypothetical protein EDC01DRAFT_648706 [Geopyxis carbonaria]
MPSKKDRLYVALYARGGSAKMPGKEDTYHWALIVGPKVEVDRSGAMVTGTRYHAKEGIHGWVFEEQTINLHPTNALLVRVMVGKIEHKDSAVDIIRETPIKPAEPGWNCVSWVQEALAALQADGKALGTSNVNWNAVRDTAMWYVEKKKAEHRFDGKGDYDPSKPPTWDLLQGRETIQ